MLRQNFQYDFETFVNEVILLGSINGALSDGLSSGLICQFEWDNAYRYIVCDISRRLPAEDSVPKSFVIQVINNSLVSMDYICFIVFERKITVDMRTS